MEGPALLDEGVGEAPARVDHPPHRHLQHQEGRQYIPSVRTNHRKGGSNIPSVRTNRGRGGSNRAAGNRRSVLPPAAAPQGVLGL
eukprot:1177912-Prorocentrum_minimum.AAC.2